MSMSLSVAYRSPGFVMTEALSRQYVAVKSNCLYRDIMYAWLVPKLWTDTIEEHRRAVSDAALETAAETGIGRATLYKYFPDVEAILVAWHERQIARHLQQLAEVRDQAGGPARQLEAVLEVFAMIQYEHHGTELAALLHRGEHIARAQQQLHAFISGLIAEGAKAGGVRDDVAPGELARYCLHALTAAGGLQSRAAVRRLLAVTLAGLRPPG